MSSTTTTQFYGLTQYIGTDKPDFADNNTAFRNVDADLHQVVQDSQGFTSDIADLTERVGNLNTDLTNLSGDLDGEKAKITALQNKELSQDTEISRVERNAQDMITAYNEASATSTHAYAVGDYFIYNNVLYQATAAIAVGATIVPDTNCTTTNVTSELIQLNTSLTAKASKSWNQISYATGGNGVVIPENISEVLAICVFPDGASFTWNYPIGMFESLELYPSSGASASGVAYLVNLHYTPNNRTLAVFRADDNGTDVTNTAGLYVFGR